MGTYLSEYIQEQSSEEQYLPININKITYNINYPSNFYLKLGQSKFLKVSNANDSLEEKILQKLIFKGTKYLYVLFSEYPLLLKYLTKQKMAKSKTLQSAEQEVKATQTMHEYITELGFDPKVINMTKDLHKSLEDKFKGKFMKSLLLQFANLEGTFIYNHSYLTSVLALTVGKNYTWMNYDNREKLYLGSILHDLGFKSKDNATYEDMSPAALATLDPDIKDDILNHPIRFAQKLAQVPDIHQDVIAIVRDHHGVIADKAYPKEIYANQVNLIFALFILSHEFSLKLYSISFNKKKIPDVLDKLCQDFDRGSYKKILPEFKVAIENLFLKEE
jgi:hypothetical protein